MINWLMNAGVKAGESGKIPDHLLRIGIRRLLAQRLKERERGSCVDHQARLQEFIDDARNAPVAVVPEKANEQHYEVPAEFFDLSLGKHRKYSCCYWSSGVKNIDQAEARALELTCTQAGLSGNQSILELGCGWGSLSLWMAQQYPSSQIISVSNSKSQKAFIDSQAEAAGLSNLRVITADMNEFTTEETFDRVVSIEMFEHMRNHELLMQRIAGWLIPGGYLYIHIFCHRAHPYLFLSEGPQDWMSEYFFSGGMMPSDELLLHYQRDLTLSKRWRWSGRHYQKTCEAWLQKTDQNRARILPVFAEAYGADQAELWLQRWRIFYLACSELFGYRKGNEWWVSHYKFQKD